MLRLKNIYKEYRKGAETKIAVDGISLDLPDKGLIAISGGSGSGKTTLLRIISGFESPDKGSILIDGYDVSELSRKDLRKYRNHCVRLLSDSNEIIDYFSAAENVMIGLSLSGIPQKIKLHRTKEALENVGFSDDIHLMPKSLSILHKKQILLARLLADNPRIIAVDEIDSGMDLCDCNKFLNILKKLSKTMLVIIVIRDCKAACGFADRIISLRDGEIISDGVGSDTNFSQNECLFENMHTVKLRLSEIFRLSFIYIRRFYVNFIVSSVKCAISLCGFFVMYITIYKNPNVLSSLLLIHKILMVFFLAMTIFEIDDEIKFSKMMRIPEISTLIRSGAEKKETFWLFAGQAALILTAALLGGILLSTLFLEFI